MGRLFGFIVALTTALLVLAGCEPKGEAPPPPVAKIQYHGVMESGFQAQIFYPDTGEGPWWFSADTKIWDKLQDRQTDGSIGYVFFIAEVTFEGKLDSDGGRFGPSGEFSGEVTADKLIEFNYLTPKEFKSLRESYANKVDG